MPKWSEDTLQRKSAEFEALASIYRGHSLQDLELSYFNFRGEKDNLDLQLKPINQRILVLETLIAEKFAEDDLKTVSFENGNRLTVRFERPVTIQDKEAFITWLKANGREFELSVYANSVKRITRECQEDGLIQGLPPGLVEGEPAPVITYTRRK